MANSQTVKFPIDIVYKAAEDPETSEVRKYYLSISLTLEEFEIAEGCGGQITINGAVMPVDDHPQTLEEPKVDELLQGSDSMQEAA